MFNKSCIILLTTVLILLTECCFLKSPTSTQENSWHKGKSLFIEFDCSACHNKIRNDEILFKDYIEMLKYFDEPDKIERLYTVLNDRNHKAKGVHVSEISKEDLKNLTEYILVIKDKKVVKETIY